MDIISHQDIISHSVEYTPMSFELYRGSDVKINIFSLIKKQIWYFKSNIIIPDQQLCISSHQLIYNFQ